MEKSIKSGAWTGFFIAILGLLTIPFLPIVAAFAERVKRDGVWQLHTETGWITHPDRDSYKVTYEVRQLPKWLSWFDTPDQWLPGGMYEATVYEWFQREGWYYCTVFWLLRNRLNGLAWTFGHAVAVDDPTIYPHRKVIKRHGVVVLEYGWEVHRKNRTPDGLYWAIPCWSIKTRRTAQ